MANHLDKNSPTNDSKERWLEDDVCLFLQFVISLMVKYSPSLINVSL